MSGKNNLYLFLIIIALLSSCSNVSEQTNELLRVASDNAGYEVATLSYIPNEFTKKPNIEVNNRLGDLPPVVTQMWSSDLPGHFLLLEQGPNLGGLNNSKPTEINGIQGEKYYRETTAESPPVFALFWRDGEMGYSLAGTLNGTVNEETMYEIAKSVR